MKPNLIILFFFLSTISLTAQNIDWSIDCQASSDIEKVWNASTYCFKGENGYYIFLWKNNNTYTIQSLDNKMTAVSLSESKLSSYKGFTRGSFIKYQKNIFELNKKHYLLTMAIDQSSNTAYFLVEVFDESSKSFTNLKEIQKVNFGELKGVSDNEWDIGYSFEYYVSDNNQKFATYLYPRYAKREVFHFIFNVFSSDLNLDWAKTIEIPMEGKYSKYRLHNVLLSDDGKLYLNGQLEYEENKATKSENEILGILKNGEEVVKHNITHPEKLAKSVLTNTSLFLDSEKNVILSGLYAEYIILNNGTYHLKINSDLSSKIIEDYSPMLTEKMKIGLNGVFESNKWKKSNETQNLNVGYFPDHQSILGEDESIYHLLRYSYEGLTRTAYVVKINNKGILDWVREIPMESKQHINLFLYESKNQVHVLFNDYPENILLKPNQRVSELPSSFSLGNACLTIASLKSNGDSERRVLSSFEENQLKGGIRSFSKSATQLFLWGLSGNKKIGRLGIINIE